MQPRFLNDELVDAPPDVPMTFVTSESEKNVHVFIPESFELGVVKTIAENFSRQVQQPIKVFHDERNQKFRLCPLPDGTTVDTSEYGSFQFCCDKCDSNTLMVGSNTGDGTKHIPRPRNSWILYRQYQASELTKTYPGITASELSKIISVKWKAESLSERVFWDEMAKLEESRHKEKYPDYKYSAKSPQRQKKKRRRSESS